MTPESLLLNTSVKFLDDRFFWDNTESFEKYSFRGQQFKGLFITTSLMCALRARTANLNTMHEIMCNAFMIFRIFFLTAKIITIKNLFTY